MTTITLSDGTNSVTIEPEYDYKEFDRKQEARHRTRTGSEYVYKFGDYRQFKFSLRYLTQAEKNLINYWWDNNVPLYFGVPFDVALSSDPLHTKYIGTQNGPPHDAVFSDDGLNMYILGANLAVYHYALSEAWNISTAVYSGDSFSFTSEATDGVSAVTFCLSGTKMYTVSVNPQHTIFEYTLSTAWDVTTATYSGNSLNTTAYENQPNGLRLTSDGLKMFVVGFLQNKIHSWNLAVAGDLSTASYVAEFSVNSEALVPTGLSITPDGTRIFVTDQYSNRAFMYDLTTAWDITTAVYTGRYLDGTLAVGAGGLLRNIFVDPNGRNAYLCDTGNNNIIQYALMYEMKLTNRNKPVGRPIKPYSDLFSGQLELETYK